jgi:hypothetical protein
MTISTDELGGCGGSVGVEGESLVGNTSEIKWNFGCFLRHRTCSTFLRLHQLMPTSLRPSRSRISTRWYQRW